MEGKNTSIILKNKVKENIGEKLECEKSAEK